MNKNISVVGCGYWGKNLVRNFKEIGSLYCISDPDVNQAKFLSDKYQVLNKSFEDILSDDNVDAVVIAAPAFLHASMAIKSMNAGKHVYVEKPIAMNEKEAIEMIKASKENNVHLMVGHLLQYHPVFKKLKDMIKLNDIGELKYLYSNRLSLGKIRTEEDIVWSFAPHDISMILSLAGSYPKKISTYSSKVLGSNIPDTSIMHMIFPNNVNAHIHVSWINPFKEQKLTVIGSKGMMVFDDTLEWEKKLVLYQHIVDMNVVPPTIENNNGIYIKVEHAEPLKEECKYFVDLISSKVSPLTDGEEGLRVLRVLESSKKSGDSE